MAIVFNRIWRALALTLSAGLILIACGGSDADQAGQGTASTAQMPTSTQPPVATEPGASVTPSQEPESQSQSDSAVSVTAGEIEPATEQSVQSEPSPTMESASEPTSEAFPEPENPAPALGSIDSWHNSPPLILAELRGSPVLLVFWADY